jgi:hypothetical protein
MHFSFPEKFEPIILVQFCLPKSHSRKCASIFHYRENFNHNARANLPPENPTVKNARAFFITGKVLTNNARAILSSENPSVENARALFITGKILTNNARAILTPENLAVEYAHTFFIAGMILSQLA